MMKQKLNKEILKGMILGEIYRAQKLGIAEMQREAFLTAKSKGFHPKKDKFPSPERICARLMLIVTEVAEACEDARRKKAVQGEKYLGEYTKKGGKPCGFPSELADIAIRLGDLAEETKVDLEGAIRRKMAYNKTRGWKHFKKI